MTKDEFNGLKTGDIIKNQGNDLPVVVMVNYGDRVTAVQTFDVTNPQEWDILGTANYSMRYKKP